MRIAENWMKLVGAIIALGMLSVSSAYAGVNCSSANITKTGVYPYLPDTTRYIVYATCDDTTKWAGEVRFFMANDNNATSLYAAALTAVSTGNKVDLLVTSTTYGVVKMLSLKASP